jgi:hypothetical protein
MPQLQKGTTYTGTGVSSFVTHTNLNAHVDNAKLLGGAIDEQVSNSVSTDQDLLLVNKGGDLFKQTKAQFTQTINSQTISTNKLSVAEASTDLVDTDVIEMTGVSNESYIDLNNASIFSSNTTKYNIDFGFGTGTAFPAPTGWNNSTTYNFFGGQTNFKKGVNVGTNEGHDILIEGDVTVNGNITSNGKPVMTGTAVAMKSGQCGIFGTTVLHKTGLLDIPADETWIITFLAHWTTGQSGNTRPDGYYTVTASVEKDTYSDVTVGSWTKVFPPYAGLCFINTAIKLTRGDLANMTKRLKFTANWGVVGSSTSGYSILLTKVKTEAFDLDSSIL